jgi:two-component system sensor histidine kinase CpxA
MKLFLRIFLWFLAAVVLLVGVVIFITRTFQTEPMETRWQRSMRNQMGIYGGTAEQIAATEGDEGLRQFLARVSDADPSRSVALVAADGSTLFGDNEQFAGARDVAARAAATGGVEFDSSAEDKVFGADPVRLPGEKPVVLVIRWERSPAPSLFFGSTVGYLRLGGLLLTALIVCYLLTKYLTSPIRKIRNATQRLAQGDLKARVDRPIARRRDELGELARDFDEMAERIESLITSQQRLSRDVSHELRSPLARMNVALEIAKQKANPETQPVLDRIEIESQRLNDMIGRLLTLARLESGAEEIDNSRVDLAELVRDVAADADFEARANGRYVQVAATDRCTVAGSENLLRSAIENVLRNAVKYTGEGTTVDVSLVADNGHARVLVSDHGGGVPKDELDHLFKPFYRVGEARERKTGGIGLGLAIAERAVKAHKGSIVARNHNGGLQVEIELDTVKV